MSSISLPMYTGTGLSYCCRNFGLGEQTINYSVEYVAQTDR